MKGMLTVLMLFVSSCLTAQTEVYPHCQGALTFSPSSGFRISAVADAYDITHYAIHLELYDTLLYTKGYVAITATVVQQPLDSFWFELTTALPIDSIRYNGQNLLFNHNNDEVVAFLPAAIGVGQMFSLLVYYQGVPPQQANRRGMMLSNAGIHPALFTHSSLFWAKNWLPVKQQLSDKIDSIDLHITTQLGKKVASHGILVGIDTLANQKARWNWKSRFPIAYYLIALSVSDYVVSNRQVLLPGRTSPMPIQDFSFPVNGPSTALLDTTGRVLRELSLFWGTYPFAAEKYGHAQTNMGGAMEHQTLSGMGFYNLGVIVHEAAHQWFGDYVTCATPSDIWLNEGFATYAEALFVAQFDSTAAANIRNGWQTSVRANAATGTVYVPAGADFSRVLNTNLSYRKPALVLHNLRWLLGDSLFFGGLQHYLSQRGFGNATTEEFRVLMEQYTGISLTTFINAWIYGGGFPDYSISWNQRGNELLISLFDRSGAAAGLFDLPYPIVVVYTDGRREKIRLEPGFFQLQTFPIQGTIQNILTDPENWVLESAFTTAIRDMNLAVDEVEKTHFVLYPNPATNQVTLQFSASTAFSQLIEVYNMQGKMQLQQEVEIGKTSHILDILTLPPGIYLLRSGNNTQRLVIQR